MVAVLVGVGCTVVVSLVVDWMVGWVLCWVGEGCVAVAVQRRSSRLTNVEPKFGEEET